MNLVLGFLLALLSSQNISNLWKSYEKAEKADQPRKQLEILEKIKSKALEEHDTWNFYDAWGQCKSVNCLLNWKLSDSLSAAMDRAVENFGEPVAVFFHNQSDSLFVDANEGKLKKSRTPQFWKEDFRITRFSYSDALAELFENDWQYACWASGKKNVFREGVLKDLALLSSLDKSAYEKFVMDHKQEAVSLIASQSILLDRLQEQLRETPGKTSSAKCVGLYADCMAFEQERQKFASSRGISSTIAKGCTVAGSIMETLSERRIRISVESGILNILLRNIKSTEYSVRDSEGKIVLKQTVSCSGDSFFVYDTVKITLPVFDDGLYRIEAGKGELAQNAKYRKYTISNSYKCDADGCHVFAADYLSGEPLGKVSVNLYESENSEPVRILEGLDFSGGYVKIPKEAIDAAGGRSFWMDMTLKDGSVVRKSLKRRISAGASQAHTDNLPERHCLILTDRSAYVPDETLQFKLILYEGTYDYSTVPEGEEIQIEIYDAEGRKIGEKSLQTNRWGSVSGDFILKRANRGGTYNIMVESKGRLIGSRTVRVEDFVLPGFEVIFDNPDREVVFPSDSFDVSGTLLAYSGHKVSASSVMFSVNYNGKEVCGESLTPDSDGHFSFRVPVADKEREWQLYAVTVKVVENTGETHEFTTTVRVVKPYVKEVPKEYFFEEIEGFDPAVRIVGGKQPLWSVVELYGMENRVLERKMVSLRPEGGLAEGIVSFKYKDVYPDVVKLKILYFQNKKVYTSQVVRRRPGRTLDIPLEFTRFEKLTAPGVGYSFELKTSPNVECAVSIFDKSTETVRPNEWDVIRPSELRAPSVYDNTSRGTNDGTGDIMIRGVAAKSVMGSNGAVPFQLVESAPAFNDGASSSPASRGYVRKDFRNTLAWEPALNSGKNGAVKFDFNTYDNLSTYFVQVFAHDVTMRNSVLRREMKVTVPVKVSVLPPQHLYVGDTYIVTATVSGNLDRMVEGTVTFNGSASARVSIPAGGSACASAVLVVPGEGLMDVEVVFTPDEKGFASDAVAFSVPVSKPVQTILEAHSCVLKEGESIEEKSSLLRSRFKENVPLEEKSISILEMVTSALPEEVGLEGEDAISLCRAIKAGSLLGKTDSLLIEKLKALRHADGGFGWFRDMNSSAIVTCAVLEMLQGILDDPEPSVRYLDKMEFCSPEKPIYHKVSLPQYMYARSLYPDVPFTEEPGKEYRKAAKEYLLGTSSVAAGNILAKVLRCLTLSNLSGHMDILRLWCGRMMGERKCRGVILSDIESLSQYGMEHKDGGIYFPNAVMPFRGLLESELYAHVGLSRLMERYSHPEISEGIRLWMMLQKETQQWGSDPAYIEAIHEIMKSSKSTLNTKILSLTGRYSSHFKEVSGTANGFSISVSSDNPFPKKGDKLTLTYRITSEENRSFVHIVLPRPACLSPVNQLSGPLGWNSYRSVGKSSVELWMDVFPEGETIIREECYVTSQGEYQWPTPTVECLYAPHYRANAPAVKNMKTYEKIQ